MTRRHEILREMGLTPVWKLRNPPVQVEENVVSALLRDDP